MQLRRTLAAAGIALAALLAQAQSVATADQPDTVNLTDIPVDDYPVCHVEDCSDVPNQEGLWESRSGDWYFIQQERTWLIVDNTAKPADPDEMVYLTGYTN